MKHLVILILASTLLIPLSAAKAGVWLTPSDVTPSNATTMIVENKGRLFPNPDAWIVSRLVIPYADELAGAPALRLTIYFIPDAVTAANVDWRVSVVSYAPGDLYNVGGFPPTSDDGPVAVGGSASQIYSQTFDFGTVPAANEILQFNISRWIYGDATDTYPSGIFIYAIRLEAITSSQVESSNPTPIPLLRPFEVDPNPFLGQTTIRYELAASREVAVRVYAADGRTVDELSLGHQSPGPHSLEWDLKGAPAGVYYFTLILDGYYSTSKAVNLE